MSKDSHRTPPPMRGQWVPLMCPCCRGLFRAPSDSEGRVECPLCDSAVLLPRQSCETAPRPIEPLQRARRQSPKTEDWDKKSSEPDHTPTKGSGVLAISIFLFSLLLVVGGFLMMQERTRRLGSIKTRDAEFRTDVFQEGGTPGIDDTQAEPNNSEQLLLLTPKDIGTARAAAENFFACQSWEEMKPLIREPERVLPLMEDYYAKNAFAESVAMLRIDPLANAQVAKRFASFGVILKDYSIRPIALEVLADGPLVDWESWVGYCEIPWETFILAQTKTPTLVRVVLSRTHYYNFNFRDEEKWVCFKLERTSDESELYGYLPFDSPFLAKLPAREESPQTFTIAIHFPKVFSSKNQVLISEVLQSGWVLGL